MQGDPHVPRQKMWVPDIRSAAKYVMAVGAILYLHWVVKQYLSFDGIFEIGKDQAIGGDFINYWSAARLALQNHIMVLFDPNGYHAAQEALLHHRLADINNWSYPPFFLGMIIWLGFFPYPVALVLWLTITFALYAAAVAWRRPLTWGVVLTLLLAPVTYANFDIGQNGFLSAAFMVGALRLLDRRPAAAGVLIGCLSFKPQLGLLIPFALIAARKWQAFLVALLTIAVLVGLSIVVFGIDPWIGYWRVTVPYQQAIMQNDVHVAYTRMAPTPFMAARILGADLPLAYALNAVTAVFACGAVIYAFIRKTPPELRNAVLLTATFLASPYLYFYDMTIFGAGVVATAAEVTSPPRISLFLTLVAAWLIPVLVFPLNKAGVPATPLVVGLLLVLQLRAIAAARHSTNT